MAIKRYTANADNTITNSFKSDTKTRATGSNMGASDILEVFSIYGQSVSGSAQAKTTELSRVLVNFPITNLVTDRTNADIPASGSVSFYLRMFNAEHGSSVPSSFTLSASAVTSDWEEGFGLDMEGYRDITRNGVGSSWTDTKTLVSATATLTALSKTSGQANTRKLLVTDAEGNSVNFNIDNGASTSTATAIAFGNANSNATQFATNIAAAINAADTANTLNITAESSGATVTLTMITKGVSGNSVANVSGTAVSDSIITVASQFSGGDGDWSRPGGDYDYDGAKSCFEQTFTKGTEDLEIDVTTLVEQWMHSGGNVLGDKSSARYGIGLFLTGTQEGKYDSTEQTNGRLHNPTGSVRSYYTKRFFSRTSEFFFKRPILEARWDSAEKENRGNFYLSSSLAPAADNLNTLYLYNYIRGQLKDAKGDTTLQPTVELYIGSGTLPETQVNMRRSSDNSNQTSISATRVSTGLYSVTFAVDETTPTSAKPYLFDVWKVAGVTAHTGSEITPKNFGEYNINPNDNYVTSMSNLKSIYSNSETARLRVFTRKKDWNPTIYSTATTTAEVENVEDAYYKIIRIKDDLVVTDYGTGSLHHTRLSYDISGSYFDFDMAMLDDDYMYGFKYTYYLNGKYVEQPEIFRFRVEKNMTDVE